MPPVCDDSVLEETDSMSLSKRHPNCARCTVVCSAVRRLHRRVDVLYYIVCGLAALSLGVDGLGALLQRGG